MHPLIMSIQLGGVMKDHKKAQPDDRSEPENKPKAKKPLQDPPRTTTGKFTAPKFGSAGSGGAELEPGPKKP